MTRIAVLIDGGQVRALAKGAGRNPYDPDFTEKVALACKAKDEEVLRFLYYDCAPYNGRAKLPVSGKSQEFSGSDEWLNKTC